jgi:hypothetical protein
VIEDPEHEEAFSLQSDFIRHSFIAVMEILGAFGDSLTFWQVLINLGQGLKRSQDTCQEIDDDDKRGMCHADRTIGREAKVQANNPGQRMRKVNISQVDVLFSNGIYPIEFLFYFKERPETGKIRRALRKLSSSFWPAFGEYKDGIVSFDRYVEDECYIEETVDRDFIIPETENERLDVFFQYTLPDPKRMFLIKATHFKNGTVLVPKMEHLAGDGYSYFYLLSALAALTRQTMLLSASSMKHLFFKPQHRRTILKDFSFQGTELKPLKQEGKFTIEYDEIPRQDVLAIIREFSDSMDIRISTNDVLTAMAVKKLEGVQKEFKGEIVELTIPIDVRRRLKEYGRRFFGNGIMLHKTGLRKEEVENLPPKEMALRIRKSMPFVSKQSYLDYLAHLEKLIEERKTEKLRPFDPASGCLVTNISRLPVDKLDFGTGAPALVFPLTVEKNAAAILADKKNFILRYAY